MPGLEHSTDQAAGVPPRTCRPNVAPAPPAPAVLCANRQDSGASLIWVNQAPGPAAVEKGIRIIAHARYRQPSAFLRAA